MYENVLNGSNERAPHDEKRNQKRFFNFTFSFEISASKKLVSSDLNARMSPNKVAQFDQHRRRIARAVAISRIGDAGNTTLVYFDVRIGVSLSQRNLIPAID